MPANFAVSELYLFSRRRY